MRYASCADLDRAFDAVYVSPHLDDVALSCGGRILRERAQGRSALVVTVFTADSGPEREIPPSVHARVGTMAVRRREDERAMERLGASFLWLGYPEAIFRARAYHTLWGAFCRLLPSDRALSSRVAEDLLRVVERVRPQRIYWPLGVGHHVDHRVTFEAGVIFAHRAPRAITVCFYEDAPYALIPYLVEHRMRRIRASVPPEVMSSPSLWTQARCAYRVMMTLDSVRAEVGSRFWRAVTSLFLFFHFLRGMGPRVRPRWDLRRAPLRLIPETCEIGSVLAEKMEVIAAYRSQIAPVLGDLESYRRLRVAYSERLAVASPGIFERVWCLAER